MRNKTNVSKVRTTLAIELARAQLTQADLAKKLSVPSTTLSDWLREAHPGPGDLYLQIEKAMGLVAGTLVIADAETESGSVARE